MTPSPVRLPLSFAFQSPAWMAEFVAALPESFVDDREAMRWAVLAARRNVENATGGPFGAVVVESASGAPLAVGVNQVVSSGASPLHAEICALLLAQSACGTHDLADGGRRAITLFSSAEPCAMCLGAIPWSGVRRLVCAARDEDVRAIGFDEGLKPSDWPRGFARRGIEVVRDVLREDACHVLKTYVEQGGILYGNHP